MQNLPKSRASRATTIELRRPNLGLAQSKHPTNFPTPGKTEANQMVYEGPWPFPCAYVTISAFTADTFLNGSCSSHIIASPAPLPPIFVSLATHSKTKAGISPKAARNEKISPSPLSYASPSSTKFQTIQSWFQGAYKPHKHRRWSRERFFSSNGHQKYSHQFNQEATEVPNLVQIYSHEAGMLPSIANSIALYRLTAANYCCGGATSCTPSCAVQQKDFSAQHCPGALATFPSGTKLEGPAAEPS